MNHARHILFLLILLAGMAQAVLAGPTQQKSDRDSGHGTVAAVIHRIHVQDVEPSEYESDIDPDVTRTVTCIAERTAKAPKTDWIDFQTPHPDAERPIFLVVQSFLI